jgi:hypothetical protein
LVTTLVSSSFQLLFTVGGGVGFSKVWTRVIRASSCCCPALSAAALAAATASSVEPLSLDAVQFSEQFAEHAEEALMASEEKEEGEEGF